MSPQPPVRPAPDLATVAGATTLLSSTFLLTAAPTGVLFGANALEMAVVAIAGVGAAVVHLSIVIAVQARELGRRR